MIRRILATAILTACTAIVVLGAERATFVLRNGDRVSGELTYKGGTVFTLDGRDYPSDDVAVIEFVSGDPGVAELQQLPDSSRTLEHERDMFVLRDGTVVRGKLYHIAADGSTIVFDPLEGRSEADRRSIPSSQVARVYVNARHARDVFRNVLNVANPAAVATAGVVPAGSISVAANRPWTDTGITVRRGDRVSFTTTGQIQIATGSSPELIAAPDGSGSFAGPHASYPVPAMAVGGLIGRVGNSAPFPIGSNSQPITMPANGRLYLGINDDQFGDNAGAFAVSVRR